jgi:hypothetical protein
MEPLFAIQFRNPRRKFVFYVSFQIYNSKTSFVAGILIDIECKFLARNFNESLQFALLVDG